MKKLVAIAALALLTPAAAFANADAENNNAVYVANLTQDGIDRACAAGTTVLKKENYSLVKVVNGRLQPVKAERTRTICN